MNVNNLYNFCKVCKVRAKFTLRTLLWVSAHALLMCVVLVKPTLAQTDVGNSISTVTSSTCTTGEPYSVRFENNAGWDLCITNRVRENLVLSNVRYTNAEGEILSVLASAGISQLHVAYDDSAVTYNDVTEFGLGNEFMVDLTFEDCPAGEILFSGDRAATCITQQTTGSSHRTSQRRAQQESLNLFSVSQVGAYTYVLDWTLYDDGTVEPAVGATGALQRSSPIIDQTFGRVLSEDADTQWLSHTHNYYWRLDFDLGISATDDVVSESRQVLNADGQRITSRSTFTTEQARRIDPETYQSWTIYENADTTSARGYRISPQHHGHRLERKNVEPYTDFDFFITVANDCERFASDNTLFNPECNNHVLEYANDEPLTNADIVAWHRVAFHHVPRNEDQRHMHAHWDAFQIRPVNVSRSSPNAAVDSQDADDNSHSHANSSNDSGGFFGALSALWLLLALPVLLRFTLRRFTLLRFTLRPINPQG